MSFRLEFALLSCVLHCVKSNEELADFSCALFAGVKLACSVHVTGCSCNMNVLRKSGSVTAKPIVRWC